MWCNTTGLEEASEAVQDGDSDGDWNGNEMTAWNRKAASCWSVTMPPVCGLAE